MADDNTSKVKTVIGFSLMIVLIIFILVHISSISTTYQSSWNTTPGTITDHRIIEGSDFGIEIDYTYTVDSEDYSDTQRVYPDFPTRQLAEQRMNEDFSVGSEISVHYSPHMPSWSEYRGDRTVEPDYFMNIPIAIGMIIGSFAVIFLLDGYNNEFQALLVWRDVKSGKYSGKRGQEQLQQVIEDKEIETNKSRTARIERLHPSFTNMNSIWQTIAAVSFLGIIIGMIIFQPIIVQFTIIFGLPFLVPIMLSIFWDGMLIIGAGAITAILLNKYKGAIKEFSEFFEDRGFQSLFFLLLVIVLLVAGTFALGGMVLIFLCIILFVYFGAIAPIGYGIYLILQPFTILLLPDSIIYSQGLPLFLSQLITMITISLLYYWDIQSAFELERYSVGLEHSHQIINRETSEITAMASSDLQIAYAYMNGGVYIQNIGETEAVALDHTGTLTSLVFADIYLIGCSDRGIVHTWNTKTYELSTTTTDLSKSTTTAIIDKRLILADQHSKLVIIDLETEEIVIEEELETSGAVDIEIHNKTAFLLDMKEKLLEIDPLDYTKVEHEPVEKGNSIIMTNYQGVQYLYLALRSGDIKAYQLDPVIKERFSLSTSSSVRSLIMVDTYMIAGLADGQLQLFDLANHNQTSFVRVHLLSVDYISYSTPYLITASNDGTVKVFDLYKSLLPAITDYDPQSNRIVPKRWISQEQARELVYCYICMTYTTPEDKIVRCPSCRAAFHQEEINQWFRRKLICPICRDEVAKDISYE